MKIKIFGVLTIILALTLTACPEGDGTSPHTHDAGTWITTQQPTCTEAGTKELRCTVDNFVLDTDTIPALGHDWGAWEETAAPTTTTEGEATRTCNTCGATEKKAIDKLPACTCAPKEHYLPCDCGGTDCTCIEQTEPTVKTFQTKDLFEGKTATIKDERTSGSQNLEELGIVTQIEVAITAGFNGVEGPMNVVNKNRFRGVFGVAGGVTIIVNNPTTSYEGALTPDAKTMTFHISYLQSNPADINQKIIDAVTFMSDPANFAPAPKTITQNTTPSLAFDGTVTIKTSDPYTASDWNAVVANVITAFNAAYENVSEPGTEIFFEYACAGDGAEIVLENNLVNNWEVKQNLPSESGVQGMLYIKTGSINSITADSYMSAFMAVLYNNPATSQANATSAKDRMFLA